MTWAERDEVAGVPVGTKESAFLWCARGIYAGCPAYERWCAGFEFTPLLEGWLNRSRAARAAGVSINTVAVLNDPLTEYQHFLLAAVEARSDAGEAIAGLDEARAVEFELPDWDYWLVDDVRVVVPVYRDHELVGAEVHTDAGTVAQYRQWRDLAARHASPLTAAPTAPEWTA